MELSAAIYPDVHAPRIRANPGTPHRGRLAVVTPSRRDHRPRSIRVHGSKWILTTHLSSFCGQTATRPAASSPAANGSPLARSPASTACSSRPLRAPLSTWAVICHAVKRWLASTLSGRPPGSTARRNPRPHHRYKGTKGVRRCREAVDLMDAGAQSPQETRVRLLLIDKGFPRPETQIPLLDHLGLPFAYLDMGWRDMMIAVEYDGEHHRTEYRAVSMGRQTAAQDHRDGMDPHQGHRGRS